MISRCDYSHMGMAIRLLLNRYTLSNAKEDERHEKQNVFTCTPYADFDMTADLFLMSSIYGRTASLLYFAMLIFVRR